MLETSHNVCVISTVNRDVRVLPNVSSTEMSNTSVRPHAIYKLNRDVRNLTYVISTYNGDVRDLTQVISRKK